MLVLAVSGIDGSLVENAASFMWTLTANATVETVQVPQTQAQLYIRHHAVIYRCN